MYLSENIAHARQFHNSEEDVERMGDIEFIGDLESINRDRNDYVRSNRIR